jgi:hypothetical protein
MKRSSILGVCALALFLLGMKCLPDGNVTGTTPGDLASNCTALLNTYPGSFAFVPPEVDGESSTRAWVLDGTKVISPFDVEVVPPVSLDDPDDPASLNSFIAGAPYNLDGGPPESDPPYPSFEEIVFFQHAAFELTDPNPDPPDLPDYTPLLPRPATPPDPLPSVGVVTTSGYDHVLFFNSKHRSTVATSRLFPIRLKGPAGTDHPGFPPVPGNIRGRTGVATLTCAHPVAVDPDVDGPANSLLEKDFDPGDQKCAADASSFWARGQTGVVLTDKYLFVSTSNYFEDTDDPPIRVYFPGTVLVYNIYDGLDDDGDLDDTPVITPVATIQTYGFNPSHLNVVDVTGDGTPDFVLVTVSGADNTVNVPSGEDEGAENYVVDLGVEDPELGQRQAAIEVIDITTLYLVARYPLGAVNLSPTGLAISPTHKVAIAGSREGRWLLSIDLTPLAALIGSVQVIPPRTLDADVIRDFDNPFQVAHLQDGADDGEYPGWIGGVAINQAEDYVFAADEHDGTVMSALLSSVTASAGNGGQQLHPEAAPIDSTSTTDLKLPAVIQVRPGDPAGQVADVFFLIGKPEGNFCAVDIKPGS